MMLPPKFHRLQLLVQSLSKDEDVRQELYLLFFSNASISSMIQFSKQNQEHTSLEILVTPKMALALNSLYNEYRCLEESNEKDSLY
jgi:hypothetical protein